MSVWMGLVSFAAVAGLLTLVPGVDTALVLRAAIVRGTRHAFTTALGVGTGVLVWGAAAACGLSVLLTTSQLAYTVLRIAGAVYLVWLGVKTLVTLWRNRGSVDGIGADDSDASGGLLRAWARGAATNLLNPKVGVFYIAMLPQFIPPEAPHLAMGVALAVVHGIEGMLWFSVLIYGVQFTRTWVARPPVKRAMEAVTGSVLLAFGLKLAVSETP
ncbi:LysE family translocator [Nocardia sp. GCM10030253]|uniref:LysE family translocator n=1 Tax=Nocardia sp. GCM10030253 TaxID=3273404 RepID=UPI003641D05E